MFAACTLLSSFGFFAAFGLGSAIPGCRECLPHQSTVLAAGYLVYIAMLVSALIAYFRMGIAWAEGRRLGLFWPVFGTIAAVSTLCGVGLDFNHGISPHLGLLRLSMIFTGPAIALSVWMVVFHSRRTKDSTKGCSGP
jgi:hypothetical protein